jgi:hypothetical protein
LNVNDIKDLTMEETSSHPLNKLKAKPKKWAQKATAEMKDKGTEGSLTAAAHKAGYGSALAYAHHIQSDKEDFSGKMRKKAGFAVNINR